jgi:integrase
MENIHDDEETARVGTSRRVRRSPQHGKVMANPTESYASQRPFSRWLKECGKAMSARQIKVMVSKPTEYPGRNLPYAVRWRLNGRGYWRSFARAKGDNGADAFYALMKVAAMNEREWDPVTGLPPSVNPVGEINVAQFCRSYIHDEWRRLSPSTRRSYVEALTSLVINSARRGASAPRVEWRAALTTWMTPSPITTDTGKSVEWVWSEDPLPRSLQTWLTKNSPNVGDLTKEVLYETDRRMRISLDGVTPYAPSTQSRLVTVAKTALWVAVKKGLLETVLWPRREGGATANSDRSESNEFDDEEVPSVEQLRAILDAIPSHQPASHMYRALSAVCAYAGLRPGEAVVLEVEDLLLPDAGWGSIRVSRAWSGVDGGKWSSDSEDIAGPKTKRSRRTVPISPVLVAILTDWMQRSGIASGPLFLTRSGSRPTQSNWSRTLHRACKTAGWETTLSPYGLRRTNASHLAQTIPIAEAASRLGHSVEVLTKHYVKRVAGQVALSNQILDGMYSIEGNVL